MPEVTGNGGAAGSGRGACRGVGLWRAILVAATLVAGSPGPAAGQVPGGPTQNAVAGARVFGAKGCVECHAVRGLGGVVGPDLGRIPQRRSFYDLAAAMWNHLPAMGERMRERGLEPPRLNDREIGNLIAFLFSVDYFDVPGDVERGRRLFVEKRCVACHQVAGTGGVVGPNLDVLGRYGSPILVAAALWNHGPAMAREMAARGIERPTFTGSELTDLVAFLESSGPGPAEGPLYVLPGRADRGRRLFDEKGCIRCHSVAGEGGTVAPDLAARGARLSPTGFAAAMWNKAPAMTAAMRAMGVEIPRLEPEEMADLVAFLYAVRYFADAGEPSRGRRLLREKGCLRCHSLQGRGGATAPDLGRTRAAASEAAVISAMWGHILLTATPEGRELSWPTLRANEMADLTAFLLSVSRSGP